MLKEAVTYNQQHLLHLCSSKRKLPNNFELKSEKKNFHIESDFIPTCTFTEFLCIYQNNSNAEFSKINDIFISSFGCLNVDNEKKNKF